MVELGHSQNVAWPILSGANRGTSDCRLAVASLAATSRCMVEGLHLATVRICSRDCRGLAADSTLDSLGSSVDRFCPSTTKSASISRFSMMNNHNFRGWLGGSAFIRARPAK